MRMQAIGDERRGWQKDAAHLNAGSVFLFA
jgi:hypothetical protein